MVSRKHAEFRLEHGRCTVNDQNSRCGTILNGEKLLPWRRGTGGRSYSARCGRPDSAVVSIEQSPAEEEAPRSDIGRMDTVHQERQSLEL